MCSCTPSMCWSWTAAICARRTGTRHARCCRCPDGLRLSEHIVDTDGALIFRQACVMGLEGIVAKRRDSRYRSGRCREWIKVKNRAHPAFERAVLIALSKRTGSRPR